MKPDPLATCLIFSCCGIILDRLIGFSCEFWCFLIFVSLVGWFLFRRNTEFGSLFIFCGILCAFATWHHLFWNRFTENDIGHYAASDSYPVCIRGNVVESAYKIPAPPPDPGQPIASEDMIGFVIHATQIRNGDDWDKISGRAVVYVAGTEFMPRYADSLQIFASLSEPQAAKNPGDIDRSLQLRCRRIRAIVRAESADACSVLKSGSFFSPGRILENIRRSAQANLHRYMTESDSPIASAMLLGFREDVGSETEKALLETGTMHILSISGMHVALIAGAFYMIFRFFAISGKRAAALIILVILFYFSITDMRPPALRATILICIACCSVFFNRRIFAINTLAATALVVLVCNPTDLFQFGPQLSFLATSVFLWVPSLDGWFKSWEDVEHDETKIHSYIRHTWNFTLFQFIKPITQMFVISLAISMVSLPLIVDRIHLITPVAILVNPLLWIPLTAAMICGFFTMICGWFCPPLAACFGWFGSLSFAALMDMIDFFHALPGGHFWSPGPTAWWSIVFYVVLICFTLFPLTRPKTKYILSGFAIWCSIGYFSGYVRIWERSYTNRTDINVLSIGHGTSTLVLTPDSKAVICDAGCFSRPIISANAIANGLWKAGKTRIDAIILSHPDTDHYNAVPTLAERFTIGAVYVSPYMFEKEGAAVENLKRVLNENKIPIHILVKGNSPKISSRVSFTVLHPSEPTDLTQTYHTNSTSLVVLFEQDENRFIFPGDLETKKLSLDVEFLDEEPISCFAIMVPHHGGNSNMTEPLLRWSEPESLVISGGKFTYNADLIQNFRNRGYKVYHTLEDGFVRISIDRGGVRIYPER